MLSIRMSAEADVAARIETLREEIRRHDHLYYAESRPEISDAEYDRRRRELAELEQAHPELISPDSPTQRVSGQRVEAFAPVAHADAMLSLDNALSVDELREFQARLARALPGAPFTYVAEPKIDGLGVALLYERGRFVRGATRGDGRVGEDITAEPAHDQVHPRRAPRAAPGGRRPSRSAARCTCRARPFAGSTPLSRKPANPPSPTRATRRREPSGKRTRP